MIKSSIEKLAFEIGYDIGMSNNDTQAKLLNGFCTALHNSMSEHNRQTQLCYVVDDLDTTAMEIVKEIYEFINLKEKDEHRGK